MALTEEFMFENVAYRPTIYLNGGRATRNQSIQLLKDFGPIITRK